MFNGWKITNDPGVQLEMFDGRRAEVRP